MTCVRLYFQILLLGLMIGTGVCAEKNDEPSRGPLPGQLEENVSGQRQDAPPTEKGPSGQLEQEGKKDGQSAEKTEKDVELLDEAELAKEAEKGNYQAIARIEKLIMAKKTELKIAYLTFDDGPYHNTWKILKTLKEKKVKATFFVIGKKKVRLALKTKVPAAPIYKKEAEDGHTVANHTYSHKIKKGIYVSAKDFLEQVDKMSRYLKELEIPDSRIIRFPGGSRTAGKKKQAIVKGLRERKLGYVDWSAEDGDGKAPHSEKIARDLFRSTIDRPIEVILLHDYNKATTKLLPEFIDSLRKQGYLLCPLFYESCMVKK